MGLILTLEQSANIRGITLTEMAEFVEKALREAGERSIPTDQIVFGRTRTGLKSQLRRVELSIPDRPSSVEH